LATTHAECERIVATAGRDARQILDEARERVAAVGAEADRRAEAARAAAVEEVLAAARDQAAMAVRDAAQAAWQPHDDAEQQVSELVSTAVGLVRTLPAEGRLP
jgi:hypothetical protein